MVPNNHWYSGWMRNKVQIFKKWKLRYGQIPIFRLTCVSFCVFSFLLHVKFWACLETMQHSCHFATNTVLFSFFEQLFLFPLMLWRLCISKWICHIQGIAPLTLHKLLVMIRTSWASWRYLRTPWWSVANSLMVAELANDGTTIYHQRGTLIMYELTLPLTASKLTIDWPSLSMVANWKPLQYVTLVRHPRQFVAILAAC